MVISIIRCNIIPDFKKLYINKENARQALKTIADERRHKLGVRVHDDSQDVFSYTLGWEECFVMYSIVDIETED